MQLPSLPLLPASVGVMGSAWASGAIAGLSIMGIPAILSSPSTSATVWAALFYRGAVVMPKIAGTTAVAYFYAAYKAHQHNRRWTGFVMGGLLTVAIVPYTIIFMGRTNEILAGAAEGAGSMPDEAVSELLKRWGTLNLVRSLLPLAGTIAGLLAFGQ